jgi:hypothetical protein
MNRMLKVYILINSITYYKAIDFILKIFFILDLFLLVSRCKIFLVIEILLTNCDLGYNTSVRT